jgi:hypothetical protein
MFVADYKHFFTIPHTCEEVVPGFDFGLKFGGRIHRRINFTAKSLLGRFQGGNDSTEAYVTYYHQVHIAAASLLGSGHGTIDEGYRNAVGQGRQRLAQNITNPSGFDHQAL